jgi:hypothetical protein
MARFSGTIAVAACLVAAQAVANPNPVTIGVAPPQGQLVSADGAESVRQALIGQLHTASVEAVPLTQSGAQLDGEAQAKHCTYVLYLRLEQKHSAAGMFSKLAPLASALPFAALGRGASSVMANAAMQQAASAAASQAASQLAGTQANIKKGDTIAVDYRLIAPGSATPVKTESLSGKASADGEDVLTPLVTELAGHVDSAASGTAAPPAATATSAAAVTGSAGTHGGATAGAGAIDCARISSMKNASMSYETCQQMLGMQQQYTQAAADPSATRPGDEQMSCDQIIAELRQQQFSAPDKGKAAAAQQAVNEQRTLLAKDMAESRKLQAEDQAAMDAAMAADRATELATGGLVQGRATYATERTLDAKNRAAGERMAAEAAPVQQKTNAAIAGIGTDMAGQLASNPRLARLTQLAGSHHCHGS